MASLTYQEVYSRFFTKVEAYDLIDEKYAALHEEFMCNWLHAAVYYPHIRKLFSSVAMDDDECTITYEMGYSIDESSDGEFIAELLSYGMAYAWVQPKVRSLTNIYQNYSSSDVKYFSQAQHMAQLQTLLSDTEKKIRDLTSSRGFLNNPYLDGNAASANLKVKS